MFLAKQLRYLNCILCNRFERKKDICLFPWFSCTQIDQELKHTVAKKVLLSAPTHFFANLILNCDKKNLNKNRMITIFLQYSLSWGVVFKNRPCNIIYFLQQEISSFSLQCKSSVEVSKMYGVITNKNTSTFYSISWSSRFTYIAQL